jgi:hypothetical protein
MANKRISELNNYTLPIDTDLLPIVDVTANETKKITLANLKTNIGKIEFDGSNVYITI